jgi:hypothetical protein
VVAYEDFDISFIMENYRIQKDAKIRILPADEKIIDRLRRIANLLLLNASFIDNPGLLNGKMGIAIFFYHYSRYTNNKIYEDYAGELIDEIYEEINTTTPVNFENGLTGIGWGIEYLVKNKFVQADTDEALSEIDTTVYRNSLYRPFLIESGNDLFGYGLYYITRLREHGDDDNNLNTLFKKQHLIYLTDDCERILIQKKYLDFKIESLSTDTINSFLWFLLEMHQWGIFRFKVEKLFHSLPEYISNCLQGTDQISAKNQLIRLTEDIIPCVKERNLQENLEGILKNDCGSFSGKEGLNEDEALVRNFINSTWQRIIYEPCAENIAGSEYKIENVFQIIDNEQDWNKRIGNINKNNLGLTGLTGIGLGLLFSLMQKVPEGQKLKSSLLVNT